MIPSLDKNGSVSLFSSKEVDVGSSSVQGDKAITPPGRANPSSLIAKVDAKAKPPPAESPAI